MEEKGLSPQSQQDHGWLQRTARGLGRSSGLPKTISLRRISREASRKTDFPGRGQGILI